jgi:hypothetical protein
LYWQNLHISSSQITVNENLATKCSAQYNTLAQAATASLRLAALRRSETPFASSRAIEEIAHLTVLAEDIIILWNILKIFPKSVEVFVGSKMLFLFAEDL